MSTSYSEQMRAAIDAAVPPRGGPPKVQGPALNAALHGLAALATAPARPRLVLGFEWLNLTTRHYRFFRACTLTRVQKDAGLASVSYALDGGPATALAFDAAGEWAGTLPVPAGSLVAWVIAYADGAHEGFMEVEGLEEIENQEDGS